MNSILGLSHGGGLVEAGREPARRSPAMQWGRLFLLVIVASWLASPVVGFLQSLSLLTLVGFVATVAGFGRPALGVLGITLLCTLDPVVRHFLLGTGLLRWNTFNYVLLLIMGFSAAFVWRVADAQSRLLKALIALLVVDLVFSPDIANGIQHVLGVVTLFGLLASLAQAGDDPDLWYMVGLMNGVVGALGGLAFLLLKETLPYMNANAWALFPETAVFATCLGFRYAHRQPHGQLWLASLAGINAMWTFLSGSRGGILIVSVGLLFILLTMKRASHRIAFVITGAAIVMVGLSVFGDMESFALHRINKMLDDDQSAASRTSGRSDLALAGLHMVGNAPFGVGTGGFAPTWAKLGFVPGLSAFKRGEEFSAHSAWIKVLSENGWPGLFLLVAYVGSFAWSGIRSRAPGAGSLGIFVTVALFVSFLSTEFQGKAVWFLAAAATAQLHPAEMARSMRAEVERFLGRTRRVLTPDPDARAARSRA